MVRVWARGLLEWMVERAGAGTREWARAMLGELDEVEGDWAALFWALGGVGAVVRGSVWGWLKRQVTFKEGMTMSDVAKKVVGLLAGVGVAMVMMVTMAVVLHIAFHVFPGFGPGRGPMGMWLGIAAVVEVLFVGTVVGLWKRQRAMAVGVLVMTVLVTAHMAMTLRHW
jgi:hypothetical protein